MNKPVVGKVDGNLEKLQIAQEVLVEVFDQAARESLFGTMSIEVSFQNGIANTVTKRSKSRVR